MVYIGPGFDRAGHQTVSGVDVSFSVEQRIGGRHRGLQGSAEFRVGAARVREQARHAAQVTGYISAEVRCRRHPSAPVGGARAQLGRPQQGRDRAYAVATS